MNVKYKLLYVGVFEGIWISDFYRKDGFERIFDTQIFDFRNTYHKDITLMNIYLQECIINDVPDIIFINKGERIFSCVLHRIKRLFPHIFIVTFNGDQTGNASIITSRLGKVCDAILINNKHPKQWEEYKKFGVKNIYEYHTATDLDVYSPKKEKVIWDIIFVGGNYKDRFPLSRFRLECIQELAKKFNVAVCGPSSWKYIPRIHYLGYKYGKEFSKVVSKSKAVLGISAFDEILNYTSNRTWNSMACGKPYVCHNYKGIENFFRDGENIIVFRNIKELIEKVDWVINNEEKAQMIGDSGRKLIENHHTYYHRAKELLDIYERWKEKR